MAGETRGVSQISKILIGVGTLLVLLSFGMNMVIYGARRQAETLGDEVRKALVKDDPTTEARFDEFKGEKINTERTFDDIVIVSYPLMAQVVHDDAVFPFKRTPALVSVGKGPYILRTDYHEGEYSEAELTGQIVALPLKAHYRILCNLFIPGLLCVALGWAKRNSGTPEARPSTVRDRSSSLDTVLRSAPPMPPPDGLFQHDPSTAEEDCYGRFVRGKAIGKGSMGEVYRCTSCLPGDKNTYALKVLLPEWSKADDFRTRFEREADICRKLDHPNLVRAYDHGEKDGRLWLVMDFVDGEELETWLQTKRSEETLIKMFSAIFQGLEYAHKVGVVHRDLKPGNILVQKGSEQPVIADFGLAKGKHYATITKTNTTLGTPTYIAPEQITGGKGSPQSDLYSLGCVMYEALAGVPPFEEKDVMALLTMKLMQDTPIELPEDTASPMLRSIVNKLLAHSPQERYQSAAEVVEALNS
jgi:serine/threonine protein kinase